MPRYHRPFVLGYAHQIVHRSFVAAGAPAPELSRIRQVVQRNRLTGDDRFADAIAGKTGRRIEARGRGRETTPA